MSILHRRRQVMTRAKPVHAAIPPWAELRSMKADQVKALAERLGIEYTTAITTKSVIHNSRPDA